ncbi:MAG: response regulator [Deltaproteobacteria bacterium]|jgi:CheY-like chemotaxis protein|nr:response regulator [Deltaproteobacteria bacterium]
MNKILIVNHDEIMQMLYADELSDEGYDVCTLGDSSRVLTMIRQEQPDLIVMEATSGRYKGLDLIKDIRDKNHEIPVILCIAYPGSTCGWTSVAAEFDVVDGSNIRELKCMINRALLAGEPFQAGSTLNTAH